MRHHRIPAEVSRCAKMVTMTNNTDQTPLSGRQFTLVAGGYRAVIASVGASVRTLQHQGRDLLVPYSADEIRPFYRGATLAPWPNRVVDGRYLDGGGDPQQLSLSEPARGHALHGLVGWSDFAVTELGEDQVTLRAQLPAQAGYPHPIAVQVSFGVDEGGLTTTVTGTNLGADPAPWGTAPHPYLVAGPGRVDDWTLHLPAARMLTVTSERLIPLDLVDVEAHADGIFDFRTPGQIGGLFIDHAFTALERNASGRSTVTLRGDDGSGVAMSFGPDCPWVQIHTADQPVASLSRLGLAVEPMTCAPDAFNSGLGLVLLGPGEQHAASWTISALDAVIDGAGR